MNGTQQQRPASEREMLDWQREAMDMRRQAINTDRANHPAIMERLDDMDRKLNMIFAKLIGSPGSAGANG